MEYVVSEKEHAFSLLAFLKERGCGISIKKIKKAIEEGQCLVNGRIESFSSRKLCEGDLVFFACAKEKELPSLQMEIVFEDEYFVVVNKPPGLICTDEAFQKKLGSLCKLV